MSFNGVWFYILWCLAAPTPRYSTVCSSASFPSSLFIAQKEHPLYCGNVISQYCHVLLIIIIIMIVMIIIWKMSPNHTCDYCDYQLITIYLICKRQGKIARYDVLQYIMFLIVRVYFTPKTLACNVFKNINCILIKCTIINCIIILHSACS